MAAAERGGRRIATAALDARASWRDAVAMRVPLLVSVILASAAHAQVSASLVANMPFSASWTMGTASSSASHPAGPVAVDGSLSVSGPTGNAQLQWTVPAPGSAACSLTATHYTPSAALRHITYLSSADVTMSVAGPNGKPGHVQIVIEAFNDFPSASNVTVDIGDDGSLEATAQNFWPFCLREWRLPVVLGPTGLDVRLTMNGSSSSIVPGAWWTVDVEFVPWSDAVTDLGSSCAVNDVGWTVGFPADNHPYFLHGEPTSAPDLCRLVARGHGPVAAFIVATDPTRVGPGWLGIGHGCDDLLQNSLFTLLGAVSAAETWEFVVPALPPGLTFYVQHASFGPGSIVQGQDWRTGVTNLVQVQS